jgi:taurine dioxygenase
MQVTTLSPALGAEVTDIDATRIDDGEFLDLRKAWNNAGGLLVIRDQHFQPEQQVEFARRFGPLFGEADQFQESVLKNLLPGQPALYRLSNKRDSSGQPLGRARAGTYWHSDVSFRRTPAQASLLYGIEVPEHGGDTQFASLTAAYNSLSPAMQALLQPLDAVHDFRVAAVSSGTYSAADLASGDFDGNNRWTHPVVTAHPETQQPTLYINPGFTSHLDGFERSESDSILNYLYQHCQQAEFVYRHRWQPNDLLIWDNRCTMHCAVSDYTADRYLHRATVIADTPVRYCASGTL